MSELLYWFGGALGVLVYNLKDASEDLFLGLWNLLWGYISSVWYGLNLPTFPSLTYISEMWTNLSFFIEFANRWVPLAEGAVMLGAYITFYAAWVPIRIILRHLPLVGG